MQPTPLITVHMFAALAGTVVGAVALWARRSGGARPRLHRMAGHAWVLLMLADWLIGSAAAAKEGRWSSAKMREGAWHKGGMILVVCIALVADSDQVPEHEEGKGVVTLMTLHTAKGLEFPVVVCGSLEVSDGIIRSYSETPSQLPQALDGEQDWLLPGLVELHTDNLDKFFTPRPKVDWPAHSAMSSHDALMVASGITTVLDAVAIGDVRDGGDRKSVV